MEAAAAKAAADALGAQAALASELPKEPGGGAGGMAEDAEEIPGRPMVSVGARVRVLAATASAAATSVRSSGPPTRRAARVRDALAHVVPGFSLLS